MAILQLRLNTGLKGIGFRGVACVQDIAKLRISHQTQQAGSMG
jgi:hypothetical protein